MSNDDVWSNYVWRGQKGKDPVQEQWADKTQGNHDRGHGEQDAVRVGDPCRAGAGGAAGGHFGAS